MRILQWRSICCAISTMAIIVIFKQMTFAQSFNCDGQIWMLEENTERLVNLRINPSNNAVQIIPFINDVGQTIDAIAFNYATGDLYGLNESTFELYIIRPDKTIEYITTLPLSTGLEYRALVFNKQGDKLITVGSVNDLDRTLEIIDINDYSSQVISFTGNIHVTDYVVHPHTGELYAYNLLDNNVFSLNLDNLNFKAIAITNPENQLQGLFFDSFGTLYGFGSTAFGVASALFRINVDTGRESRLSTGPEALMKDFANCPYRVEARLAVEPRFSFPCNEVEYSCWISNSTGLAQTDLSFDLELPLGFKVVDVKKHNVDADFKIESNGLTLRNLKLHSEIDSFKAVVEIADIDAGNYLASGTINGLSEYLGSMVISDNPNTIRQSDATNIEIKRIDEDSIFVSYFFCRDDEPVIDGFPFGINLLWENGSSAPSITVSSSGVYKLEAKSGCKTTIVLFDVTIANCPFNIEMNHLIEPDTIYPCSEVNLYFLVDNDTGNTYENIDFSSYMLDGISLIETIKNPYGGDMLVDDMGQTILISDMVIPDGLDTLIFRVEVGDINPGLYGNSALIKNFPADLGNFRFSDNPKTPELDSTILTVLGVDADSTFVDKLICQGERLLLEGSQYGFEYLWENGSLEDHIYVDAAGIYELQIFSGCEISYVFFQVENADNISATLEPRILELHLGDSLQIFPTVYSENDIIRYKWTDPQDTTISCFDCANPFVRPYFDNVYTLVVSNDVCQDTLEVYVNVDKTRKIYAPTIFSPGLFDINAEFSLQSPDFAVIEEMVIVDRWGTVLYEDGKFVINDSERYWDGWANGKKVGSGTYFWSCRIRFLDNVEEAFYGAITLVR